MSLLSTAIAAFPAAEDIPFDDKGYTTINPILPPTGELILGTLSFLIIFALFVKFGWPLIKEYYDNRTSRIQQEIDESSAAKAAAETEAANIRAAKGDIDAERGRLYAEADAEAEALLRDGRARLENELVELERRADMEIEAAANRTGDELSVEIASLSSRAIDGVVQRTLDDSVQQELIENFIARVGATTS
jgi:F-type H+-transporting ATPase subunit b